MSKDLVNWEKIIIKSNYRKKSEKIVCIRFVIDNKPTWIIDWFNQRIVFTLVPRINYCFKKLITIFFIVKRELKKNEGKSLYWINCTNVTSN